MGDGKKDLNDTKEIKVLAVVKVLLSIVHSFLHLRCCLLFF